jgi:hypothetical protein
LAEVGTVGSAVVAWVGSAAVGTVGSAVVAEGGGGRSARQQGGRVLQGFPLASLSRADCKLPAGEFFTDSDEEFVAPGSSPTHLSEAAKRRAVEKQEEAEEKLKEFAQRMFPDATVRITEVEDEDFSSLVEVLTSLRLQSGAQHDVWAV